MNARYCFWSVCTGDYGRPMQNCVRTALEAGVFKEFHVLCDQPLAGCECYDALECDKNYGLFKLHYLKAAISRLQFDFFVWVDADTIFVRAPAGLLSALGRSPIHVPLEANLSALSHDQEWHGVSCFRLRDLYLKAGIGNQIYLSGSAFWIVRREAIDSVYELAMGFWHLARGEGLALDVGAALGYAMQMLCAYPERHLVTERPDLWATDYVGRQVHNMGGTPWGWKQPLADRILAINPAVIHVPRSNGSGGIADVGISAVPAERLVNSLDGGASA